MLDAINIKGSVLNELDTAQKLTCLRALAYMSKIDGHIHSEEASIIALLAKSFKLTDSKAYLKNLDETSVLEQLSLIQNPSAAVELIKYLCFIGHADSNLNDDEALFVGHAAQALGVDIQKAAQINEWVINCLILEEQERELFS